MIQNEKPKVPIQCFFCTLVMDEVLQILKGKFMMSMIEYGLKLMCHFVPSPFERSCYDIIQKYIEELIDFIKIFKDGREICSAINLCPYEDDYLNSTHEVCLKDVQLGECLVCRTIMKVTKEILKNSYTRDKIQKALNKVCMNVKKCQNFLNKHFNRIMDLLLNATTRGKVCKIIGVCSVNPLNENHAVELFQNPLNKDAFTHLREGQYYCKICRNVLTISKTLVKPLFTQLKVRFALKQVCRKLSGEIRLCATEFCRACIMEVDIFKNVIRNKMIGVWMTIKVVNLCHFVPNLFLNSCKKQVYSFLQSLLRFIRTMPARWVCQKVRACVADTQITAELKFGEDGYKFCESAVNLLKSFMKIPEIHLQIYEGFHAICKHLKSPLDLVCHNEVNSTWEQWTDLLQTVTSKEACNSIGSGVY